MVSGNVKLVSYQPGSTDQFYHKYEYDADNRITSTLTSDNGVIWQEDARYFYYLHGPLARVKLGSYDVQGVDYAYTIQGWLKSMNGVQNLVSADIGKDGEGISQPSNPNKYVGRDVAAFSLRYFSGDYQSTKPTARNLNVSNLPANANLYNGNIAAMSVGVHDFGALSKTYFYDYLNRLMDSESYPLNAVGAQQSGSNFATLYSYDLNGNILTLKRNGNNSQGVNMDDLQYSYNGSNNRLRNVYDLVSANTAYTNDFKNTNPNLQFGYDQIGNLTSDLDGNTIAWNPYGKVASVVNSLANRTLSFGYSATGERVFKEVNVGSHITDRSSEYYVRDASGNLMALYEVGVQAANTAANISTINAHLSGIDPSYLQNLMQAMLQNRAFLQTLAQYIVENRWLAEYLAQSNLEIASFFAWNPGLIRVVFGNEEIRNYFYGNQRSLLINAINCDPVDLLTLMLSDPTKGRHIIDLICQNGNYHGLMQELFNEMGVSSCSDLKNMLQTHAMAMALVIKHFNEQQQPVLLDILTELFSDPAFVSHFAGIGAFNDFLAAALTTCIDPLEIGSIMNDFWGGDFARFLEYVGEQAIIESLFLGNFESFFLYLTTHQSASEIMTTIINRMQNFTVVEYLEWIRMVLGQSVYNQIIQLSPNILNFEKVITLKEQYLYGSKRLGVRKPNVQLAAAPHTAGGYQTPNEPQAPGGWFNNDCMCYTYEEPVAVGSTPPPPANTTFTARFYTHTLGKKEYELTNHLGNVLATVLDRKTGVKASPTATTYAYFKADVTTAQDYYPFGSLMPGRTYVAPANAAYRFGFGGHEKLDEVSGSGNTVDMGDRWLDVRLGRTPKMDAKAALYPGVSPYAYALNTPIWAYDPDGKVVVFVNGYRGGSAAWKDFNDPVGFRRSVRRMFSSEKLYREDKFDYWGGMDERFMNRIGDHNAVYADASSHAFSTASYRYNRGQEAGEVMLKQIKAGDIQLQTDENGNVTETIKIVSHSQGGAYAAGMSKVLTDAGYKVEVEYNIAPKQPGDIPETKADRRVQYGSDQDIIADQSPMPGNVEQGGGPGKDGKIDGHLLGNFKNIFNIKKGQDGYVAPRKDVPKND